MVKNPPDKQEMQVQSLHQGDPLENGNPIQYSHLGNLIDRGAWQAIVHAVKEESDATKQLNSKTAVKYSFQIRTAVLVAGKDRAIFLIFFPNCSSHLENTNKVVYANFKKLEL